MSSNNMTDPKRQNKILRYVLFYSENQPYQKHRVLAAKANTVKHFPMGLEIRTSTSDKKPLL